MTRSIQKSEVPAADQRLAALRWFMAAAAVVATAAPVAAHAGGDAWPDIKHDQRFRVPESQIEPTGGLFGDKIAEVGPGRRWTLPSASGAAITPPRCSPGGVLFGPAQRGQAARLRQQD